MKRQKFGQLCRSHSHVIDFTLTFSSHFVGDTDGGYVEYGDEESGLDGESSCVGMLDIKFEINC